MRALLAVVLAAGCCWGADEREARAYLSREILGPKQATVEVQAFVQAHTPVLPGFRTAAAWRQYAERLRARVLDEVVLRGEAKRWSTAPARVEWLGNVAGEGYRIRKLRFEAVPGFWVPALLYEPEKLQGKVPVVLNVNGHEGNGKAIPYIQARCINQAKRGMLALNPEWIGKGELSAAGYQHTRLQQLDLCGTSGVGVFYLSLKRSLDILLGHANADARRVAVTGLSGGGWQTIMISALDPRVTLANPVAGYSSFVTRAQFDRDLGDSEQTPSDLGAVADYTHLTALMAPRPTLLTYNAQDSCCFRADSSAGPLVREALPFFRLLGAEDKLRYHLNFDNGHNFGIDNREALYRMIGDLFYPGDRNFRRTEIPVDAEIRTAGELAVEMPAANADLHKLALALAKDLPRKVEGDARSRLAKVVRAPRYSLEAFEAGREGPATNWRLSMGRSFTVPAVELAEGTPKSTVILLADAGRASLAADAARLLSEGKRVVAVDPFYFGESRMAIKDWLYAILLAALGERPLGIQAAQVAATARWLEQRGAGPVEVLAEGPRTGLAVLVAAALEPKAFARVTVRNGLTSLKEIVEKDFTADKTPELFCFGLLETFDIDSLAALAGRGKVRFEKGSATAAPAATASDWPRWRGPNADGVADGRPLPVRWSQTENIRWSVKLPGWGTSSPVIHGDRLFITSQAEQDGKKSLLTLCLNRDTGKELWRHDFGLGVNQRTNPKSTLAVNTPAVAGDAVYVAFGNSDIARYSLDGKPLWVTRYMEMFGDPKMAWGYNASPLVLEDSVMFSWDHHKGPCYAMGLDKETGKVAWKKDRPIGTSHATPLLVNHHGQTDILVSGKNRLTAFDAKTRAELWQYGEGEGPFNGEIIVSPVYGDGMVFLQTWRQSPIHAIRLTGNGQPPERVWVSEKPGPQEPSLLYYRGLVYAWMDNGVLACFDGKTGKELYRQRLGGAANSSPIANEGRIYVSDNEGATFVVKAGREFELVATNSLGERITASPAVSGGRLFYRTDSHVYCIGESAGR